MGAMTVKFGSFCLFVTFVVQENAGLYDITINYAGTGRSYAN